MADVLLVESSLMLEEKFPAILSSFPNVKVKGTHFMTQGLQHTHPLLKALFYHDPLCFTEGFPGKDDSDSCHQQVPAAR